MPSRLLVGEAELQRAEQKTAEAPLVSRYAPKCFVFQQVLKK
jgi:hypothetical protein